MRTLPWLCVAAVLLITSLHTDVSGEGVEAEPKPEVTSDTPPDAPSQGQPEEAEPAEELPFELQGKIVGVTSGDTLTLMSAAGAEIIHVLGIDAPDEGQPYANRSKRVLTARFAGKEAVVVVQSRTPEGEAIGEVNVGKQRVGLQMVRAGMAWHAVDEHESPLLAKSELAARKAKRGLWRDKNPVPPWVWRDGSTTGADRLSADSKPAAPQARVEPPSGPNAPAISDYWLNTTSNVRHNRRCEWFNNTSQGRYCTRGEGRRCGYCGG